MCYSERVGSAWRSLMADACKTRCWVSPTWEFHTGTLLTGTVCSPHFIPPCFVLVFTKMLYNLFSRAAVTRLRKVSIHSWPFRDGQSAHTFWRLLCSTEWYWMHLLCLIRQKLWSTGKYDGAPVWDMVLAKGCEFISWVFCSQTCQQFRCGFKQITLCILFTY